MSEAPPGEPSDHDLLVAWREHEDQHAARQLYDRHFETVYRFFRNRAADPNDVNDLVNDTFSRLFVRREHYTEIGTNTAGQRKVRPFLFGIAKNVLFAYIREYRRIVTTVFLEDDDHGLLAESLVNIFSRSPSSIIFACRELYVLSRALRMLPLGDQILIEHKYFNDMPERELAILLGIPYSSIRGRVRAGLDRLRKQVKQMFTSHGITWSGESALSLENLLAAFRDEMMRGAAKPPV